MSNPRLPGPGITLLNSAASSNDVAPTIHQKKPGTLDRVAVLKLLLNKRACTAPQLKSGDWAVHAAHPHKARAKMEVHQLRYFCAIATYGTFTRAAKAEHVAQPSLSQQILKLEDELGGKLFYRLPRATRLTALGEFFLPHALAILQEIRESKIGARKMIAGWRQLNQNPTLTPVNGADTGVESGLSPANDSGVRAFRKGA